MAFDLYDAKGCALEQQRFTWRELVQTPISKLDDDAYTRVQIRDDEARHFKETP